ncbi:MAG: hypothetical protein A2V66_11865 [Ignavibacteria bacterium RBG_13_36_8]|nr:MAG: hypothetical protein A2V66_11865 [Ignavibacteria bacterium RBG_13_36_8]
MKKVIEYFDKLFLNREYIELHKHDWQTLKTEVEKLMVCSTGSPKLPHLQIDCVDCGIGLELSNIRCRPCDKKQQLRVDA